MPWTDSALTASVTVDAVVERAGTAWLSELASRVPPEVAPEFFSHLERVAEGLGRRGEMVLAAEVLAIWEARPR
jgi:hypothetical protein